MPVAGALIGAAAGVGGSLISAGASSSAASKAAAAEQAANQAAIGEQRRQFDINQANQQPWLQAGQGALQQQLALLGLGGGPSTANWGAYLQQNPDVQAGYDAMSPADKAQFPTAQDYAQWHYQHYGQNEGRTAPGMQSGAQVQQGAIDQLRNSPLYQSLFRNGQDTLLNAAAATGQLRGGNTASSLANFGADTLSQVIQNQLANLGGISGNGMNSANTLGQFGQNSANNISQLLAQSGQAQSGGILARAGANNNAIQGISGALGNLVGSPGFSRLFSGGGGGFAPGVSGFDVSALTPSMTSAMNANSSIF